MALLTVYRGDSATIPLYFTQGDGSPQNVSGYGVFLGVAVNYASSPFIYVGTTGSDQASTTGFITLSVTSGDTDHCAGDYVANVRAVSASGEAITYSGQGMTILPTVLPYMVS